MGSQVGASAVGGSEIVQESLSAQRTVASLGLEKYFYEAFIEKMGNDRKYVFLPVGKMPFKRFFYIWRFNVFFTF